MASNEALSTSDAGAEPAKTSLFSLPPEIFFEICDYLSNKQLLGLRLLSSTIQEKLPRERVARIHSHKTYYLCSTSLDKLDRLCKSPELASLVKQISFDLESPFVTFATSDKFGEIARGWSEANCELLRQEYDWHVDHYIGRHELVRAEVAWENRFRPQPSTLRRIWGKLTSTPETTISYLGQPVNLYRGVTATLQDDSRYELLTKTYELFKRYFELFPSDGLSVPNMMPRLIASFKLLPNLSALEFCESDLMEDRSQDFYEVVREYNKPIRRLLLPTADSETGMFPWLKDSLRRWGTRFSLQTVYPAVLYAAVAAEVQVKEVKLGKQSHPESLLGNRLSVFEPAYVQIPGVPGIWHPQEEFEKWVQDQVTNFEHAFEHVKRFDILLDSGEDARNVYGDTRPSPLLLASLRNVEEFNVRRIPLPFHYEERPYSPHEEHGINDISVLLTQGSFNNLRKLELDQTRTTLEGLTRILLHNKTSLRELSFDDEGFRRKTIRKEEVKEFLITVRDQSQLLHLDLAVPFQFFIRDSRNGRFDYMCVGLRHGAREFMIGLKRVSLVRGESKYQDDWRKKSSWEELLRSVDEYSIEDYLLNP